MSDNVWTALFVSFVLWLFGAGFCAMRCVTDSKKILDALEQDGFSTVEARLVLAVFIAYWPICLTVALPWVIHKVRMLSAKKKQQDLYKTRSDR
jgi:hypothetical protein